LAELAPQAPVDHLQLPGEHVLGDPDRKLVASSGWKANGPSDTEKPLPPTWSHSDSDDWVSVGSSPSAAQSQYGSAKSGSFRTRCREVSISSSIHPCQGRNTGPRCAALRSESGGVGVFMVK
jgi:hypothetical protein